MNTGAPGAALVSATSPNDGQVVNSNDRCSARYRTCIEGCGGFCALGNIARTRRRVVRDTADGLLGYSGREFNANKGIL